jgi:UDP-N-acetylglucosamine 3-dehydrogenase
MSNPIRAGVVGVGSIGKNHARIYSGLPGVEFSAILDTNAETATAVSQQSQSSWNSPG